MHEICSYDSNTAFWQPQLPNSTVTQAVMQMPLTPVASLKVSRVSPSRTVKVKMLGEVSMLLGHESYIVSLPKLRMRQVSSTAWGMELAGELEAALCTKLQYPDDCNQTLIMLLTLMLTLTLTSTPKLTLRLRLRVTLTLTLVLTQARTMHCFSKLGPTRSSVCNVRKCCTVGYLPDLSHTQQAQLLCRGPHNILQS